MAAWAHFLSAAGHKREQRALLREPGQRVVVLFDADIVIGQANHRQRARMFNDLFAGHPFADRRTSLALRSAFEQFFYDWVQSKLVPAGSAEGPLWAMAPEHLDEVIQWVDRVLAPGESASVAPDPGLADQLHEVLRRLAEDPWSAIDRQLAPILSMLDLPLGTDQAVRADDVRRWLQPLLDNQLVLQAQPPPAAPLHFLPWPRIDNEAAAQQLGRWRSLLWSSADDLSSPSAVTRDARVLTAIAQHNAGPAGRQVRLCLLTASSYLWRAVAGQPLRLPAPNEPSVAPGGPMMSDYMLLPSAVLAADALWQPAVEERNAPLGSLPEWASFDYEPVREERQRWFWCSVWNWLDEAGRARCPWPDPFAYLKPGAVSPLRGNFIAARIAESAALDQIRRQLSSEMGGRARAALQRLDPASDAQAQINELDELRRLRLNIELIELRLRAHQLQNGAAGAAPRVNPLRSAPYVHFWGVADAHALCDALTAQPEATTDGALRGLKAAVYACDRSLHLLVLAYATAYARQQRWSLAASAASYARTVCGGDGPWVQGGEAELLELACQRRAASTGEHVAAALDRVASLQRSLPQTDGVPGQWLGLRLSTERISLRLASLSMRFFANELVTLDQRVAFRATVTEALADVRLQWDLLVQAGELAGPELDDLCRSLLVRLRLAAANLGWLSVGPTPKEAEKLPTGGYVRRALPAHRDFVGARLAELAAGGLAFDWQIWSLHPGHGQLTRMTAALVLESEGNGMDRTRLAAVLAAWERGSYDHSYDASWLRYAVQMLRVSVGSP